MNTIIVNDGITPGLMQLAEEYPREFQRGLLAVGQHWRRILGKEMRAGNPAGQAFSPLSPLTLAARKFQAGGLRRARRSLRAEGVQAASRRGRRLTGKASRLRGFGGQLPDLAEFATESGGVQVGWLGRQFPGIAKAVARWQRREVRPFTKGERRKWHVIFGETIPESQYIRPHRPPVEPQAGRFSADAQSTITKTMMALIANASRRRRSA